MTTNNNMNVHLKYNHNEDSSKELRTYSFLTAVNKKRIVIGICILIALCSLLVPNVEFIFVYLFGLLFFFGGLFVALNFPFIGLVFLITHGGSGLFTMIISFLWQPNSSTFSFNDIFNNPVFSDGGIPYDLKIYLGIIAITFISALIYTLIHNISSKLKENDIHMIIILALYFIFILLIGLLPRLFPYIVNY